MKAGRLQASRGALAKLAGVSLPVKTAYRIARLLKAVDAELALIGERQDVIVKKYGREVSGGNYELKPTDSNWTDFIRERSELMDIDIPGIPDITILVSDLGDVSLEPGVLADLDWLIVDP